MGYHGNPVPRLQDRQVRGQQLAVWIIMLVKIVNRGGSTGYLAHCSKHGAAHALQPVAGNQFGYCATDTGFEGGHGVRTGVDQVPTG
jgi:hypothetical protein